MEITRSNIGIHIGKFNLKLEEYNENSERLEHEISLLERQTREQSLELQSKVYPLRSSISKDISYLENLTDLIVNRECLENELKIDLERFSGVVNKTEDYLLEIKGDLKEVQLKYKDILSSEKSKSQSKPKLTAQLLNSRQTQKPFFYAVMQPIQRYRCISCNVAISNNSPYLRHVEEYPIGSSSFKPHSYHVDKACLLGRGFQDVYLKGSKVICEEEINNNVTKCLQQAGFKLKNIQSKIDSDSEQRQTTINSFILQRKDNKTSPKIICVSCNTEIRPDSYLTKGNNFGEPVHIKKECIQFGATAAPEMNKVKCFVNNLLRNNNELNQLLACGFLEHRIIGHRPTKTTIKGKAPENTVCTVIPQAMFQTSHMLPPPPPPSAMEQIPFCVYRRNDSAIIVPIACITCKIMIEHTAYVTLGDTFQRPMHIRKKCIQSGDMRPIDFRQMKCKVFRLLKTFEELQELLACGFYSYNIIGFRPQNPNSKGDTARSSSTSSASAPISKDIGFIFNEEFFKCERFMHTERCEGCGQLLKQNEIGLRHKERVPREKQTQVPLISQFYHTTKNCLLKRGFTEKYLEFALCKIELSSQENVQSVKDILVRCGFSSDNLEFLAATETVPRVKFSDPAPSREPVALYLHIVNCAKATVSCSGCRFVIDMNEACFIYGPTSAQDNLSKLFHIKKVCLESYFTKTELSSLVCLNNNSIADVDAETIVKCGIMNIRTLPPISSSRKKNSQGKGMPRCEDSHINYGGGVGLTGGSVRNPLKMNHVNFVVDAVSDDMIVCSACDKRLRYEKYVLQAISSTDDGPIVYMHMAMDCVRRCGYYPQDLARCDVTQSMKVTAQDIEVLRACGFMNIH